MPVSRIRSLVPITRASSETPEFEAVVAAIAPALRTASGVSIIAQSARPSGAWAAARAARARRTSSGLEIFGISTASGIEATIAAMSRAIHGVSRPLTRTTTSRLP